MSDDLISRKSLIENLNEFAPEHYTALVNDGRRCRGMGYIIAFISGAIVGVILMCVLQISSKNVQEDEEQEKYLKDLNDKHGK